MNIGFYQVVSGMRALESQQQMLASNISRAVVPGHRQSFASVAVEVPSDDAQRARAARGQAFNRDAYPLTAGRQVDFSQGPIEPSDSPLHFAIQGPGFFSVREQDGTMSYTRNGAFTRAQDGTVTTSDGATVLLEGGAPLVVSSLKDLTAGETGTITVDNSDVGKLELAHFNDPGKHLTELANGRFVSDSAPTTGLGPNARLAHGSLEKSNSSPVVQMVDMMSVARLYEANQKIVTAQDDMTSRLIRAIGPTA